MKSETLADIEVLSLQCRSDQSKTYISEALLCYRSGAYRASIVTTWIAVVFDLIDKIRELALAGDAIAKQIEDKYENYIAQIEQGNQQGIQNALEFERDILDICKDKLQFFDAQQFVDLTRLREDRHRCAHPSFQQSGVPYSPSAEQARLHIRNAIVDVLSQPPIQGKAALAELKRMVASDYFPTDDGKALQQLNSSAFSSATDALVRGFVDQLIFGFLTKDDELHLKSQVAASINAASEMYPAIVEDRKRKQLNKIMSGVDDDMFPACIWLVAYIKQGWDVLDEASQEKVKIFIEVATLEDVLAVLGPLSKIPWLDDSIASRINTLTFDDLVRVIEIPDLRTLAKERALHYLSQAGSWDRANTVFSKVILPILDILDRGDIENIIKMPTKHDADLPGAHGYGLFIEKVRESGKIDNMALNQLLQENGASYLVPQTERA